MSGLVLSFTSAIAVVECRGCRKHEPFVADEVCFEVQTYVPPAGWYRVWRGYAGWLWSCPDCSLKGRSRAD